MLSSIPGVSNHSSTARPSRRSRAPSTWRVVPGLSATSPNAVSRVRVRKSEVLPVLGWPTTAILMTSSAMAGLQPRQRGRRGLQDGVGRQAQGQQPFAPQRGARARAGLILGPRDEPHAGSLRVSGQFGDQGQGAAVGRLAGGASDQQPRGRGRRKRVQHAVAFFPRVQGAGHLEARGHVRGRPGQVGGQLQA
ncbi:hypothetical protein G6F31_016324 [Rhizopus arrhizus]|nr:hypothetical protein G6F31_016324 [Rhizopus arrhizus]